MDTITITEALAEIKTIGKRIEKKTDFVSAYLLRQEMVKDPLEKDGGSTVAIARELQSVGDLQQRLIAIRAGVQASNLRTRLRIGEVERTITDWLTWRKEVAPVEERLLTQLRQTIEQNRQQWRAKGINVGAQGSDLKPQDVVVNVDEGELARRAEDLEATLGTLDGKLSLLNATTLITI